MEVLLHSDYLLLYLGIDELIILMFVSKVCRRLICCDNLSFLSKRYIHPQSVGAASFPDLVRSYDNLRRRYRSPLVEEYLFLLSQRAHRRGDTVTMEMCEWLGCYRVPDIHHDVSIFTTRPPRDCARIVVSSKSVGRGSMYNVFVRGHSDMSEWHPIYRESIELTLTMGERKVLQSLLLLEGTSKIPQLIVSLHYGAAELVLFLIDTPEFVSTAVDTLKHIFDMGNKSVISDAFSTCEERHIPVFKKALGEKISRAFSSRSPSRLCGIINVVKRLAGNELTTALSTWALSKIQVLMSGPTTPTIEATLLRCAKERGQRALLEYAEEVVRGKENKRKGGG